MGSLWDVLVHPGHGFISSYTSVWLVGTSQTEACYGKIGVPELCLIHCLKEDHVSNIALLDSMCGPPTSQVFYVLIQTSLIQSQKHEAFLSGTREAPGAVVHTFFFFLASDCHHSLSFRWITKCAQHEETVGTRSTYSYILYCIYLKCSLKFYFIFQWKFSALKYLSCYPTVALRCETWTWANDLF